MKKKIAKWTIWIPRFLVPIWPLKKEVVKCCMNFVQNISDRPIVNKDIIIIHESQAHIPNFPFYILKNRWHLNSYYKAFLVYFIEKHAHFNCQFKCLICQSSNGKDRHESRFLEKENNNDRENKKKKKNHICNFQSINKVCHFP